MAGQLVECRTPTILHRNSAAACVLSKFDVHRCNLSLCIHSIKSPTFQPSSSSTNQGRVHVKSSLLLLNMGNVYIQLLQPVNYEGTWFVEAADVLSMQPEKEPEELIAARTKLNSASLTQQENEPAGKRIQQLNVVFLHRFNVYLGFAYGTAHSHVPVSDSASGRWNKLTLTCPTAGCTDYHRIEVCNCQTMLSCQALCSFLPTL